MRREIRVAAVLLLVGIVAIVAVELNQFRAARNSVRLAYTGVVKKNDIVATAQNSFAALRDAELREQDYILTGETVYSEAYAEDVRAWEDESGTLALISENDRVAPSAKEFIEAGKRTMNELAATVAIYEKSGREAALERIRRSSGIVYLDQAGKRFADMGVANGRDPARTRLLNESFIFFRRLAYGAGALACLGFVASTMLLLDRRKAP
jgi:CHASE3 domain sensor protein